MPSITALSPNAKISTNWFSEWGRVTSYDNKVNIWSGVGKGNGIIGARGWDSNSRLGFQNYFNKIVRVIGITIKPYHIRADLTGYAYHDNKTNIYWAKPGAVLEYSNVGSSNYGRLYETYFNIYNATKGDVRGQHIWTEHNTWLKIVLGSNLTYASITGMYEGAAQTDGLWC